MITPRDKSNVLQPDLLDEANVVEKMDKQRAALLSMHRKAVEESVNF